MTFNNGSKFAGNWVNHTIHGFGDLTRPDGASLCGRFDHGVFVLGE